MNIRASDCAATLFALILRVNVPFPSTALAADDPLGSRARLRPQSPHDIHSDPGRDTCADRLHISLF